jgi:lipopolysaccharide transport system permease protein
VSAGPTTVDALGVLDGDAPAEPGLRNVVEWSDSLPAHVRELIAHRELLWFIAQREVKVRYKQTLLGAAWAILQPFALMLVFTLFFSAFAGFGSGDGVPYPLFSYVALLPWTFFSTALSFAIPSLVTNAHIITRIYFPREIIPIASVLAALVDFGIAALLFVVMLAVFRVGLAWPVVYVLPIFIVQITFTVGICLLLSAFTVLYRDARFTLPLLIQVWMFATPILYPISVVPSSIQPLYLAVNPMAVVIDSYRRTILHGEPPDFAALALAASVSVLLLWLAYRYFKHLERDFADMV